MGFLERESRRKKKQRKMDDSHVLSSLLCQESATFLEKDMVDEDAIINVQNCSESEYNEYVDLLFKREINFGFKEDDSLVFGNWEKFSRMDAISLILKTRAVFGFRFQTAFLSIVYFDRFHSRCSITNEKLWAIRLLTVACISLAAKMEEVEVPPLSDLKLGDDSFGSEVIKRMELLVLNTLEWKMGSITPFSFIHYFISKLCKDPPPNNLVSDAFQLIWAITKEINLINHRPSVIAIASILAATDHSLTRKAMEAKMNSISHCRYLETEEVFSSYNLIKKLKAEKLEESKCPLSQELSPVYLRQMNVTKNSSISSKRKRLVFNNCDQH